VSDRRRKAVTDAVGYLVVAALGAGAFTLLRGWDHAWPYAAGWALGGLVLTLYRFLRPTPPPRTGHDPDGSLIGVRRTSD